MVHAGRRFDGNKFFKLNMNDGTVSWNYYAACNVSPCNIRYSPVLVDEDRGEVYTALAVSDTLEHLLWTVFNYSTGAIVGSRYDLSSVQTDNQDMFQNSGYINILYTTSTPETYLARFNQDTAAFEVNKASLI